MADIVVGPMLRFVDDTRATIWLEVDGPCRVEVAGHQCRTFCVEGHHYALAVLRDLVPGSSLEYQVLLDGQRRWPRHDTALPPSMLRTTSYAAGGEGAVVTMAFGSCRVAAPHDAPWSLERSQNRDGLGVDALRAYALRLAKLPSDARPALLLLLGDQVYADHPPLQTAAAIRRRRGNSEPDGLVADFEEYTWLYQESWRDPAVRWLLSTVPTAMIFDDHDMEDDWNISASWLDEQRAKPWWDAHNTGGLLAYWIYQHLGNLSPDELAAEGHLKRLAGTDDGGPMLRQVVASSDPRTSGGGGYRYGFARRIGSTRLVVIDSRQARVLQPGQRAMLDPTEWRWLDDQITGDTDHLILATSLPVLLPPGLNDAERWNEAVGAGAWGSRAVHLAERARRRFDLEHWAAFRCSFDSLMAMVSATGSGRRGRAPHTITVLSGDVHFSYLARARFPNGSRVTSRVTQVVSSPLRNALSQREQLLARLGASSFGRAAGRLLRATAGPSARRTRSNPRWELAAKPSFDNHIVTLEFAGPRSRVRLERTVPGSDAQLEDSGWTEL